MRIVILLALACLATLVTSGSCSQPISLIDMRQTQWRYYQEGDEPTNAAQPSVRWNSLDYDDSMWSEGLSWFGFEPDNTEVQPHIQTPLSLVAEGATSQTTTYYFRTKFQWNGGSNVLLSCTNIVDDGAIIYLNGIELYRLRMAGTPTYRTLASAGPPAEGAYESTNILTSRLLPGDNLLAVEVHQLATNSADVVFGFAMTASTPEPVTITSQPPAVLNAVERDDVTISVEAAGTGLRYAWFRNNVFISGATNATLTLNNVLLNFDGSTFHVVLSNVLGAVRSSNSVLRIVPDTFGPRILSAELLTTESNRLLINFSEDILRFNNRNQAASGSNVNNYLVTDVASGSTLSVLQAVVGIGNHAVRLTLDQNLDRSGMYEVCVRSISEIRTNYIALNSCVPVSFEMITNGVPFRSLWSFYERIEPPPSDWTQPEFLEDPRFWYSARGMFYNDVAGPFNAPCTSHGWILSLGPITYYFRTHFAIPSNLVGTAVAGILHRVVDDGVVFYLNGTEVMRTNLPFGPIRHDMPALTSGNPNVCSSNQMTIGHLLRERNVLAAEVHQVGPGDYDAAFDASLALRYLETPRLTNHPQGDVFLRYSNQSPTELRLFWTNGMGLALEYVDALGEPWREMQPPSTNIIVNKARPVRVFRLNKRH